MIEYGVALSCINSDFPKIKLLTEHLLYSLAHTCMIYFIETNAARSHLYFFSHCKIQRMVKSRTFIVPRTLYGEAPFPEQRRMKMPKTSKQMLNMTSPKSRRYPKSPKKTGKRSK
jgi:hypothetical protein